MKAICAVVVATLLVAIVTGQTFPVPYSCKGEVNTIPFATDEPSLMTSVTNGKLYSAGEGNDTFAILHLWGTPYEQGYAQGQLRKKELQTVWSDLVAYFKARHPSLIPDLPLFEWTYNVTKPFTPQLYIDEMQGIADGAGINVSDIINLNMFPEFIKAECTIVGATHESSPCHTIQHLRGLDFDVNIPLKDNSQITVYHGNQGVTVANFGWAGLVGSATGISNTSIGVGEKLWGQHHHNISGRQGQPWMFLMRDVMMKRNMDEALEFLKNANRTCAIHMGIGDSTTNEFRGVQIAKRAYEVYNWTSLIYPQHPVLPGIMYWDKYLQPSPSFCLSDLLKHYYGNITAELLAVKVAPVLRTGMLHAVTFDYGAQIAYYSNARRTWDSEGHLEAYNRQYALVNLTALWVEQAPSS